MRFSLAAILFVTACSLPDSHYGTADAPPIHIDAGDPDAALPITIETSQVTLDLNEGASATLAVHLSARPSSPTVVTVVATAGKVHTTPTTLVFTPLDYNNAQVVTVTAPADTDVVDDVDTLVLSSAGLASANVQVVVHDDDVEQIVTNALSTIVLDEGASTTLAVHLSAAPASPRVVNIAAAGGEVNPTPASLFFNAADYATDKIVTVTAPPDPDVLSEDDMLVLSSPGLGSVTLPVHVVDPDDLALVLSTSTLTIDEGSAKTLGVYLSHQPSANLVVNVTAANSSDNVSPVALTFTPVNYNITQAVTIAAPHDPNTVDETNTVTLSAGALPSKTVTITNHDTGP